MQQSEWCQSQPASLSLVDSCGVGAASRPSLIKEHKGDCCGSNCVWVPSPGRPDRPASHGAGSSCVLCCLSHGQYSIVPQAKEWNNRFPPISGHLPLNFTTPFFSICTVFFLTPSPSISFSCYFNLLFFLRFSQTYYFLPLVLGSAVPSCLFVFIIVFIP